MILTVLEGESLGEKCLLEGEKMVWMSHRDDFSRTTGRNFVRLFLLEKKRSGEYRFSVTAFCRKTKSFSAEQDMFPLL